MYFSQYLENILFLFFEVWSEGYQKLPEQKNSPEMNDSEVDPIARKNPDEK